MSKNIISFVLISLISIATVKAQDNNLLHDLMSEQTADSALLPQKMLVTQRLLWGEKGLMRISGIAPLTIESRKKEMQVRRGSLKVHQALGFITLGGMVAQGIVGSQLYKGNYKVKDLHEGLASAINVTYSLGAVTSLLAPPPMVNRDKKITSLRLHKWLSLVHMSGMIATNVLAGLAEENVKYKSAHRAAAYTAFASFAAAMVVIKF
ncbi:MAG: hypothetical protein ACK4V4_06380 [Sphingobacteriales bacterium]|jgi:hypothetical protein